MEGQREREMRFQESKERGKRTWSQAHDTS